MKLITELTESVEYLKEEKTGKLFIEGIFLQAGIKNKNGRIYPPTILEREVQRYTRNYINESRAMGELGHPEGPQINLDRVSHRILSLVRESNNYIGKALVLDTPNGNIVRGLHEGGVKFGVSSRGLGSLRLVNGINEVQEDFMLATAADIVADPSAPNAFVNGLMESVEWVWDNGILKAELLEQQRQDIDRVWNNKELREKAILEAWEKFLEVL